MSFLENLFPDIIIIIINIIVTSSPFCLFSVFCVLVLFCFVFVFLC